MTTTWGADPDEVGERSARLPERWLVDSGPEPPIGGQASIELHDGRIYVGTLLRRKRCIVLRLAGSGVLMKAAKHRVRRLRLVPWHDRFERRVIVQRQQRGEPAAVIALVEK